MEEGIDLLRAESSKKGSSVGRRQQRGVLNKEDLLGVSN
jgi:hypothetical protein